MNKEENEENVVEETLEVIESNLENEAQKEKVKKMKTLIKEKSGNCKNSKGKLVKGSVCLAVSENASQYINVNIASKLFEINVLDSILNSNLGNCEMKALGKCCLLAGYCLDFIMTGEEYQTGDS